MCAGLCVYAHVSMTARKKLSSSLFFLMDKYIYSALAVVQEQILSLASSADVYETRHLAYLFSNMHQKWI